MGRTRRKNKHLPRRVYIRRGVYYFFARDGRWINLGKTLKEMYRVLANLSIDAAPRNTMLELFRRYRAEIIPTKAPSTQKRNLAELKALSTFFGQMRPGDVLPKHVARLLDERGKVAPVSANREKALLSHIFSKAMRWGLVDSNPCRGVARNPERPRDRYVTDAEYLAVYQIAPSATQVAMEMSRITGLREGTILGLQIADLRPDGLYAKSSKTGKQTLYEYTPGLNQAIDQAKTLAAGKVRSMHLICNRRGGRMTSSGFQTAWQRLMRRAMEQAIIGERFTFHDLRGKALSDAKDLEQARKLGQHADARITNRIYRRKADLVRPNE